MRTTASLCSMTHACPLTPLEFGVLQLLLARKGKAVSRAMLIEEVWGTSMSAGTTWSTWWCGPEEEAGAEGGRAPDGARRRLSL